MKLYFQDANGNERFLATVKNDKQMYKKIEDFCSERGFKIPYYRHWIKDDRLWIDCGSWTEFFFVDNYKGEI